MPQTHLNLPHNPELHLISPSANLTQLNSALERLNLLQLSDGTTIEALAFQCEEVSQAAIACRKADAEFDSIRSTLPEALSDCLLLNENGFEALHSAVTLIAELPQDLWCYRDDMFDNDKMDYIVGVMPEKVAFLKPLRTKLTHFVDVNKLPDIDTLLDNQKIIESAGVFRWFSSRWRQAKRSTMALSVHYKLNLEDMASLFPAMITYVNAHDALDEINSETAILGDQYQGIDTPLERLKVLRTWYKNIRFEADHGFCGNVGIGPALFAVDPLLAETLQLSYSKQLRQSHVIIDRRITKFKLTYKGHKPLMNPAGNIPDAVSQLEAILCEQYALIADMVTDHRISLGELKRNINALEAKEADSLKPIIT